MVDLEEAEPLLNAAALSVTSTTVAASVQSFPEAGLSPLSSPTLSYLQVPIEPSTNSDARDILLENAGVSEGEVNPVDIYDFDFEVSSDIDLLRYLLLGSFILSEEIQDIIYEKSYSDFTLQTEDSQQAAEVEPTGLLERLRTMPKEVYDQVNKEVQLKEEACLVNGENRESTESTSYNSPRNR